MIIFSPGKNIKIPPGSLFARILSTVLHIFVSKASVAASEIVLAGIDEKSLLQAIDTAVEMNMNNDLGIPVPDYVDEIVSNKVIKLIQSYTGVVDKMVWRKY